MLGEPLEALPLSRSPAHALPLFKSSVPIEWKLISRPLELPSILYPASRSDVQRVFRTLLLESMRFQIESAPDSAGFAGTSIALGNTRPRKTEFLTKGQAGRLRAQTAQ